MITLNNGDSLIAKLENVVTANQPTYYVSFLDTDDMPGNSKGLLNSTSEVTIVGTPGVSEQRMIDIGTIFNKDTADVAVVLQIANGASRYTLVRKVCTPNDKLEFGKLGYKAEGRDLAEALQGLSDPTSLLNLGFIGSSVYAIIGENVVIGDVLYLKSDGKFWKADADALTTTSGMLAMATTTILANASGVLLREGYIKNTAWTMTPGVELYVSTSPGNPTTVAPTLKRVVGYSFSSNVINFNTGVLSGLSENDVINLIVSYS